jgi:CRP-like cAMP-binding protein
MSETARTCAATPVPDVAAGVVERRLRLHSRVDAGSAAALSGLLGRPSRFEAGSLIAEAGDDADIVTVVQNGVAARLNHLPDGRRQIHSLFIPGDTADAEISLLKVRPDSLQAISEVWAWRVPRGRVAALGATDPRLAEALAREAAIAAQVAREWVVNIGRRNAEERIAHLICELHARMGAVGLVRDGGFFQPLTQQDLADAQGISAVHVNRVLQGLRARCLIRTARHHLVVLDLERLQTIALFDPVYLSLR